MTSLDNFEVCDIMVDYRTREEMTSDESKEFCSDTVMADNNTTKELTPNHSDKSKEITSNESDKIYDDAGMKEKVIKRVQANTDTSKVIISNETKVCRDVSMIDNDLPIEEHSFEIKEQRIVKKVVDEKLSRSHERNKRERDDSFLQRGNYSNTRSIGKSTSATKKDDSEWDYNVIHVDSCDLQVVGGHDTEEFTTGDSHRDATRIQNVGNKVTATQEITPTDIGQSQQNPDIKQLTHLKFRKILPKVNSAYKGFNHNIEVQGKQDLMHTILNPAKREEYTYCDRTKRHKENLNRHERDDASRQYKCTYCNKTFAAPSDVKEHERIHTGEKPHKCTYCDKGFPRQSHLKRHELIHTGASPHKCKYCGKAFRNNWDVEVHERIHTGVKPYTCKLCNKAFTQRSGLNVHGRVHTGVTPYQCNQCNKAFTRKSHLMEHERIHTGVKPYKCTYCNKAFTQKGTLKKHERTHTGAKPYKCQKCDKAFTRRNDLSKHEHIHSGDKI